VTLARSADGLRVIELEGFSPGDLDAARAAGAELLWVHANDDLSVHGFRKAGAYVHLHARAVPVRRDAEPPLLDRRDYAEVLARAYLGLWGHKHVPADAQPPADAVVVGDPLVGLCRVWREARLIDAPGVLPEARSPEGYASLLLHACAVLGEGPADLESWGDAEEAIDAYVGLGFDVVERTEGWELEL
jgi:hypothetical protein